MNAKKALTDKIGTFFRASWNDGRNETWMFTENDQAASIGASFNGSLWHRENDVAGVAAMINGLSKDHRDYLAAGGHGFMIGDGRIDYAPEEIAEAYYAYKVAPGFDLTRDLQYVHHPAYNADRGPVSMAAMRVHYEI